MCSDVGFWIPGANNAKIPGRSREAMKNQFELLCSVKEHSACHLTATRSIQQSTSTDSREYKE
jgi:hypothetical protein